MNVPQTVEQFVEACKGFDNNDDIYELFEDILGSRVRNEIYAYADVGAVEPCRAALNALGAKFGVQSLANY